MKRSFSAILAIAVLLAGLSSCKKDSTILYNDQTMGNVISSGKLLTDTGLTYDIVEQTCDGLIDTLDRVLVVCDILRKVSSSEYEVRLNKFYRVLYKSPIPLSEVDDETVGNDPILPSTSWISGGCVNMLTAISFVSTTATRHFVNLVYDDVQSTSDTLRFKLRHNGFGEVYGQYTPTEDVTIGSTYVSFPISSYMPSGKSSVVVKVFYDWYKTVDGAITTDTQESFVTGTLTK